MLDGTVVSWLPAARAERRRGERGGARALRPTAAAARRQPEQHGHGPPSGDAAGAGGAAAAFRDAFSATLFLVAEALMASCCISIVMTGMHGTASG